MSRWKRGARNLAALVVAVAFVATSMGCGDEVAGRPTPTVNNGRAQINPDGTPNLGLPYFLVINGEAERTMDVNSSMELPVFLYSKESGNPVADEQITYTIIDGPDLASLSAKTSISSLQGEGSVDLRSNAEAGAVTVEAAHPSAATVTFAVTIAPAPAGSIQVSLTHTAPSILPFRDITIRVYEASMLTCTEFLPLRRQAETDRLFTVPSVNETARFEDVSVESRYVVTAIAKGPRGQSAGAGCVEDVIVEPDAVSEVDVALTLIPINPAGRYRVTANWDFTEAVKDSGPVGSTIVTVLNVFIDPGQALYDGIIDLVEFAVGGIISGAIELFLDLTNLDNQFKNLVNDAIENNDTLRKVRDAGRDLRDVIANLEVVSELNIGKLSSSFEFRGTDNWLGVNLYWRWNCDPGSPPDCGKIPIVAENGSDFAMLGVLSSTWTGRVVAYDQMQIDTHPLTLRYGRLIIYVLNEVIIPQLTDGMANSLSEAFAYWVGCDRLATSITGSDGEICALGACLFATDIESFCSTTVTTLFGFADALVTNLEFDIGLTIGGEATLVEEDSDGFVDAIEEGTYSGTLTTTGNQGQPGGMAGAPVTATWSGERLSN